MKKENFLNKVGIFIRKRNFLILIPPTALSSILFIMDKLTSNTTNWIALLPNMILSIVLFIVFPKE